MRLFRFISELLSEHKHYWGVPHKECGKLVQCCYDCGALREVTAEIEAI